LKRYYHRGSETVKALNGVDVSVRSAEMVSVLGPSGSGKTTLINILPCLDAPTEGTLLAGGKSLDGFAEDELVELRRGVLGYVFQQFALLPTLTVTENVKLPMMFADRRSDPRRTREILKIVGLIDRANHLRRELSGGQKQRVALGRALIAEPKILVADEPTGNRDTVTGRSIIELFKHLAVGQDLSILLTTHNAAFE
jgi:putative ABC transport system ATP-binding protein